MHITEPVGIAPAGIFLLGKENPMSEQQTQLFRLGTLVMTIGASDALHEVGEDALTYISKHATGEWGDLCAEDKEANQMALKDGSRIFSAYILSSGVKLYVITEWDRSYTTLLEAGEY